MVIGYQVEQKAGDKMVGKIIMRNHYISLAPLIKYKTRQRLSLTSGGHAGTGGGRSVFSQVSHCQVDVCREYEGNGRSVVGVLRSDARTCGTYLSRFGHVSSPVPLHWVRRKRMEHQTPPCPGELGRRTLACHRYCCLIIGWVRSAVLPMTV